MEETLGGMGGGGHHLRKISKMEGRGAPEIFDGGQRSTGDLWWRAEEHRWSLMEGRGAPVIFDGGQRSTGDLCSGVHGPLEGLAVTVPVLDAAGQHCLVLCMKIQRNLYVLIEISLKRFCHWVVIYIILVLAAILGLSQACQSRKLSL